MYMYVCLDETILMRYHNLCFYGQIWESSHLSFLICRGPAFDTQSGHILSFLLPLFQEGQLSVTGNSMCTKYWLTA